MFYVCICLWESIYCKNSLFSILKYFSSIVRLLLAYCNSSRIHFVEEWNKAIKNSKRINVTSNQVKMRDSDLFGYFFERAKPWVSMSKNFPNARKKKSSTKINKDWGDLIIPFLKKLFPSLYSESSSQVIYRIGQVLASFHYTLFPSKDINDEVLEHIFSFVFSLQLLVENCF